MYMNHRLVEASVSTRPKSDMSWEPNKLFISGRPPMTSEVTC